MQAAQVAAPGDLQEEILQPVLADLEVLVGTVGVLTNGVQHDWVPPARPGRERQRVGPTSRSSRRRSYRRWS